MVRSPSLVIAICSPIESNPSVRLYGDDSRQLRRLDARMPLAAQNCQELQRNRQNHQKVSKSQSGSLTSAIPVARFQFTGLYAGLATRSAPLRCCAWYPVCSRSPIMRPSSCQMLAATRRLNVHRRRGDARRRGETFGTRCLKEQPQRAGQLFRSLRHPGGQDRHLGYFRTSAKRLALTNDAANGLLLPSTLGLRGFP
jgi:hypothetical protein